MTTPTPTPTAHADARRLLGIVALLLTGADFEGRYVRQVLAEQIESDLGAERLKSAWVTIGVESLSLVIKREQTAALTQTLTEWRVERSLHVVVGHLIDEVTGALPLFVERITPDSTSDELPEHDVAAGARPLGELAPEWLNEALPDVVAAALWVLTEDQRHRDIDPCDCCEERMACGHVGDCDCCHELEVPSAATLAVLDSLASQIERLGRTAS